VTMSFGLFEEGINSCLRTISGARPENRGKVFGLMAREVVAYARRGNGDLREVIDRLRDI